MALTDGSGLVRVPSGVPERHGEDRDPVAARLARQRSTGSAPAFAAPSESSTMAGRRMLGVAAVEERQAQLERVARIRPAVCRIVG